MASPFVCHLYANHSCPAKNMSIPDDIVYRQRMLRIGTRRQTTPYLAQGYCDFTKVCRGCCHRVSPIMCKPCHTTVLSTMRHCHSTLQYNGRWKAVQQLRRCRRCLWSCNRLGRGAQGRGANLQADTAQQGAGCWGRSRILQWDLLRQA